ncbi:hypothetical protein [Actinophytocola sp. NPDC049390]|uniref:hypothetical protein n=1 Tax=Actinophytocola sp. NPDC049390 TaxID=3363894 RepID=UPI00378AD8EC
MTPRDVLSLEPLLLGPVSYRVAGVETNPTAYTVEAAVTPLGTAPSVWVSASWETIPTALGGSSWWVRVMVGPGSAVGALTPGDHEARIRITVSGSEQPVLHAGTFAVA